MSIINYKEKALFHLNNNMNYKFWELREEDNIFYYGTSVHLVDTKNNCDDNFRSFNSWEECYEYLKVFTKSTKRKWIEGLKNRGVISVIWDTDLETYERELIKDIQEIYDYKYSSFDINELEEIKSEITDEEMQKSITNLIYAMEFIYKKDTIELE